MTTIESAATTIRALGVEYEVDEAQLAAVSFLARYSGRTLEAYRHDLRGFFQWATDHGVAVMQASRAHIELFRAWMEDGGLAASTIDRRLSTVCGFYRFAHIDGRIRWNPAQYVRRPQVHASDARGLDRSELGVFLFTAEQYDRDHAALAVLLGLNGLRVSEACATNIEDLGFERGHRTLRIVGKGNKPATVPLVPRTARTIDLAVGERHDGPIPRRRDGHRLDRRTAHRWVRSIGKRAGLGAVHPHMLRAAFIMAALDAGVPLRDVQIAARHADPRTTTIYDRRRQNFDRHAAYVVVASARASSGTFGMHRWCRPARAMRISRHRGAVLLAACEPRGVAFGPSIRVPSDASAARWIAPTLGSFGTVGGLVPHGYERYLLLDYRGEEPRGWDGVCRLFEQLIPLLARHTSTPDHCWFAIWEGYGFETSMTMLAATPRDDEERREIERERQRLREDDARRHKSIRAALSTLPSFDLPNRRYYLVRGAVTAASQIERPDGPFPQPPDLWWPEDRRWFVGGDTDLDWCYIAGSERLVSAVGAEFRGQTRPVGWKAPNATIGE